MARKKTYDTNHLIALLDEFRLTHPNAKITIPQFGSYLRQNKIQIEDHTLRRDEIFKTHLNEANSNADTSIFNELVAYKTLDVDLFLSSNPSKDKLKQALMARDQYYATIALRAVEIIKAKKELEKKSDKLEEEINKLNLEISQLKIQLTNEKSNTTEIENKNKVIIQLKKILDDYVYPDVANAILKKDGILEIVNNVIADEIIQRKTIHADTSVEMEEVETNKLRFQSVNTLLGDFDE